jgi:hypothetical protein
MTSPGRPLISLTLLPPTPAGKRQPGQVSEVIRGAARDPE